MSESKLDDMTDASLDIDKNTAVATVIASDDNNKKKSEKKLYRCPECTNSVTLIILADVICTRCNLTMRLFEATQSGLFLTESASDVE